MLYGFYPEVINNQGNERETLKNLVNSYLYRDILAFSDIRRPEVLEKLLQALALQMGNEVNYNDLVSERRKQNIYKDTFAKMYFWRTKQQQEVDFVEESNGNILGYEFKWNKKNSKFPQNFIESYNATGTLIDKNNFRDFVKI